jgi:hypothetical protein
VNDARLLRRTHLRFYGGECNVETVQVLVRPTAVLPVGFRDRCVIWPLISKSCGTRNVYAVRATVGFPEKCFSPASPCDQSHSCR